MGSYTRVTLTIVETSCGVCNVYFGLEEGFDRLARQDGRWFYCPNGHHIHYTDYENGRLKKQLQTERENAQRARVALTATRDQLETSERSRAAYKGHLTRVQRRIANGVCPCCNRPFANVAEHMGNKHPEFVKALAAKKREFGDG